MPSELDALKAKKGKWCFPGGVRWTRLGRIRHLEANPPKAKAAPKPKSDKPKKDEG